MSAIYFSRSLLASLARFELTAFRLGGERSILLSYRDIYITYGIGTAAATILAIAMRPENAAVLFYCVIRASAVFYVVDPFAISAKREAHNGAKTITIIPYYIQKGKILPGSHFLK